MADIDLSALLQWADNSGISSDTNEKNNANNKKNNSGQKDGNKGGNISQEYATAPYNFVGLPTRALPSKLSDKDNLPNLEGDIEAGYKKYLASDETISGYIDLEMETLTPLFIRNEKGEPFKLGDIPVLPGSSLRGMFKNIFKIVTMSTLRDGSNKNYCTKDYIDRHVFYRKFISMNEKYDWEADLSQFYKNRMQPEGASTVRPGFLVKIYDDYYIVPLLPGKKDQTDTIKHFLPDIISNQKKYKKSDVMWRGSRAYIWTGTLQIYELSRDKKTGKPKGYLFNTKADYEQEKKRCKEKGKLFDKGKQLVRYWDLKDADWNKKLPVNVTEYMMDNNRKGVNLLDKKYMRDASKFKADAKIPREIKALVPCYYVPDSEIRLFGHGQCFRIPYDHSIGEIVKKQLKEEVIDYSDAVFGMSPYFASRVFFEDARPERDIKLMNEFPAHPLLQPNPTSFQLYLKNEKGKKLVHWDSENAEIRGYKLYWHQANKENVKAYYEASKEELAEDAEKEDEKKLCLPMRPIPANTKFSSRIRFKNLHPDELGALIMTLDINSEKKNIAFKLGQGKSIGLGSIKLNRHDLYVESKEAYTSFLTGNIMANSCQPVEASSYKQKFEVAIPAELQSEWTNIMKELTDMLDFDNIHLPGWEKGTSLMRGVYKPSKYGKPRFEINEGFKDRRALPAVSKVLELAKN